MPKARVVYQALEGAVKGGHRNIVTTEDGEYWRAVRQGTAQCFSMSNMKKVRHNSSAGTSSWHVLVTIFTVSILQQRVSKFLLPLAGWHWHRPWYHLAS